MEKLKTGILFTDKHLQTLNIDALKELKSDALLNLTDIQNAIESLGRKANIILQLVVLTIFASVGYLTQSGSVHYYNFWFVIISTIILFISSLFLYAVIHPVTQPLKGFEPIKMISYEMINIDYNELDNFKIQLFVAINNYQNSIINSRKKHKNLYNKYNWAVGIIAFLILASSLAFLIQIYLYPSL